MKSKVLYVTHRTPWPPDRGDRIRTWNILKFLSTKADVDLLCLSDEPVSKECVDVLRKVTRRLAIVPHSGKGRYIRGLMSLASGRSITEGMFNSDSARQLLQKWATAGDWTAALASSSGVAQYLNSTIVGPVPRRWVDLIDVDSEKWLNYSKTARFPMASVYRLEGTRIRQAEIQLANEMQRLLVVSEAECRLFRSFCDTTRIKAIENGVDTDYFSPADAQTTSPTCVFVGVMDYLPNVDAVCWFASEVWPQIRQRFPDARFCIVGKSPNADVRLLQELPGIEVIGPVPDVRPWLHQSNCAVIPLRIARGIQNKALEAMACGKAVVCSSAPLKGLRAEPGLHLLQADTPEEWVEALTRVFKDPVLQKELGLAASTWVQMHHCWNACLEQLCGLTAEVNEGSSPGIEVRT